MTTRTMLYTHQCIASAGFAAMDFRIAWQLRTDLWASDQDCALTFRKQQNVDGVHRVVATFPSYGEVLIYARSLDDLGKRLEWIVGEAPTAIADWKPEKPAVSSQLAAKREANRKEIERLEELRKLAAKELLGHDCQHDRDVTAARKELGMQ